MNQEEISANKQHYIALCRKHISRDGLDKVLDYLEKSDFYEAPSSASYHLNEKGGLCRHSINVFETAMKLYECVVKPKILDGTSPFQKEIAEESIAVAALFHDLCKVKLYHETQRWKKDDAGRWVSYPGYEIKDDFPLGHGEKSCLMLSYWMKLKQDEMLAIRWHMGMFDMGEQGSSLRYSFRAACEKSALVSLLQAADMMTANLLEKTTTY